MNNEDQFPTERLIKNSIAAFKNGQINEDTAMFAIDFAAKLGDTNARALLDKCKEIGVAEAFNSNGK